MNLLARLKAQSRQGTATKGQWNTYNSGPKNSPELRRIAGLPRVKYEATEALAPEWTEKLKKPEGTMSLRPLQALALMIGSLSGGLLGLIGVGAGKTLVSLLLPTVWGVKRAVLLVPPNLKTKLYELEYPELSKHWKLLPLRTQKETFGGPVLDGLHVVSYSDLSNKRKADILERLCPEAVIGDEAHALRYVTSARTKRFRRFWKVFKPKCAWLSGSLTGGEKPLTDFAHLAYWALGDGSPLPIDWGTQQEWAMVLDASEFPAPDGALSVLCEGNETAKDGFRRRLHETPGVVATTSNDPGMGLIFNKLPLNVPKSVADALQKSRDTWCRPDGYPLSEAVEIYTLLRQLACGYFYRTIYPHGEPESLIRRWLQARKDYFSEVRPRLRLSLKGQDSPDLLWDAAEAGEWKSNHFQAWKELRDRVKPETETVWIDKFLVHAAVKWAEKPGIIWVESDAVKAAFSIAEEAGIPVYTGGKEDEKAIINETGERAIVAGMKAFNAGVNLQAFNRSLITTAPAGAQLLEQVIGRTHRPGQEADEVQVDFFLHTPELNEALAAARLKAANAELLTGNIQKLSIGTWLF